MKKIIPNSFKYFISLVISLAVFSPLAKCESDAGIYDVLKDMSVIKVYVEPVTDATQDKEIDTGLVKKELENALASRMTLNMEITPDKDLSDIIIKCDVVEYFWTDKDPVDMITGIGAITMDAVIKENYSRITAVFTVSRKDGTELWARKLKATITDREMTKSESSGMVSERLIKIFMREAFSKKHSKNP